MSSIRLDTIRSALDRPLYVRVAEETGSTNDDLKAAAKQGAPDYSLLFANRQTTGKGRQGRSFFSPSGLYMSLLLPLRSDGFPFLTHIAAIAVARAIREVAEEDARIKWVNDVFVQGKKVCGILTESVVCGERRRVIVGIGVNANTPQEEFPEDLREIAGIVRCDPSLLAAAILKNLLTRYEDFRRDKIKEEYRELMLLLGSEVLVPKKNGNRKATVSDLSEDLGLIVRYENGETETLISGEVHLTPKNNR